MSKGERNLSDLSGLHVYLPDGRRLGMVHDAVVEHANLSCTHLFVTETSEELVEGSIHVAVPWRWIRSIGDVVILRWFPETPIPRR
ncbi:MAG: PRC-barrel domain-containing protein [Candidatus Thermoplasmatota archaeon]|nr:PRC-barrel domain-containing protein [Candidatus Thermoplasmatota archaeon]MEC8609622.1 PRC-barrel domain-containing protein [Candidatus Thermoplasmatota archaeon]